MFSTLQASVLHGKGILTSFTLHQQYREQSHNQTDV